MIFYLLWKGGGAGEAQDARGSTKSGKWSGESREDKSEDRGSERGIVEINSSEGQKKRPRKHCYHCMLCNRVWKPGNMEIC